MYLNLSVAIQTTQAGRRKCVQLNLLPFSSKFINICAEFIQYHLNVTYNEIVEFATSNKKTVKSHEQSTQTIEVWTLKSLTFVRFFKSCKFRLFSLALSLQPLHSQFIIVVYLLFVITWLYDSSTKNQMETPNTITFHNTTTWTAFEFWFIISGLQPTHICTTCDILHNKCNRNTFFSHFVGICIRCVPILASFTHGQRELCHVYWMNTSLIH